MKNFSAYLEEKKLNALVSEVAQKMVETNVDPWDFLMEYYKDQPEIVFALESNKEEALNEFWGGLKRFLGGAGGAMAQGLGSSAYNAAKAFAGRMGEAGKQARAAVMGPEAHYAASIEALQGLSKELNKNQAVQGAAQSNPNVKKLVGDLQGILKQLGQQKEFVKDLLARQAGSTTVTTTPGTLGANPQAQVPGATAPSAQTMPFPGGSTSAGQTGTP